VLAVDLEKVVAVGLGRRRRTAQAFTLAFRDGIPALRGDGLVELLVDVERHHRDATMRANWNRGGTGV
jgi:hypothetical protein